MPFQGGYMTFFGASRAGWSQGVGMAGAGATFKDRITRPGPWTVSMMMQGETVPKWENHVRLSPDRRDKWGIPLLVTSVGYDKNDDLLTQDFLEQGEAMLAAGGVKDIVKNDSRQALGLDIHEMGGVRMGRDPRTSMVNATHQLHSCSNVFVTDGACMTTTGTQNPSLTYMAMSARAVAHAVEEMKKGQL